MGISELIFILNGEKGKQAWFCYCFSVFVHSHTHRGTQRRDAQEQYDMHNGLRNPLKNCNQFYVLFYFCLTQLRDENDDKDLDLDEEDTDIVYVCPCVGMYIINNFFF